MTDKLIEAARAFNDRFGCGPKAMADFASQLESEVVAELRQDAIIYNKQLDENAATILRLTTDVADRDARIAELEAALEHYADESRWVRSSTPEDGGKYLNCEYDWEHSGPAIAREALNKQHSPGEK